MIVKKCITDYLTANGPSTKMEIVDDCVANGIRRMRARIVLDRIVSKNKVVHTGDNYSLPV
jgi:hypothetical protein